MEIIRSEERGYAHHGWLEARHTFSFAEYYHPHRMAFGAIRVLNDDWIEAQTGFGMHPHSNMEIITIPLEGSLEHRDSMGRNGVIQPGEVQVMSAGSGVFHSERNSGTVPVNLFQIWILPNQQQVTPRYEQTHFGRISSNSLQLLVSPDGRQNSLFIYQDAFISKIQLDADTPFTYPRYQPTHGVLLMVIEGEIKVNELPVHRRDTLLYAPDETIALRSRKTSLLVCIETPME